MGVNSYRAFKLRLDLAFIEIFVAIYIVMNLPKGNSLCEWIILLIYRQMVLVYSEYIII